MSREKISIVVPCYNEEESLPIFYEEICNVASKMKKLDFEFLFINDGSKDKTLEILESLAKTDKNLKIDDTIQIMIRNKLYKDHLCRIFQRYLSSS